MVSALMAVTYYATDSQFEPTIAGVRTVSGVSLYLEPFDSMTN